MKQSMQIAVFFIALFPYLYLMADADIKNDTPEITEFTLPTQKQGKKQPSLNRLKDHCCQNLKDSMHHCADLLRSTASYIDNMAIAVDMIANGNDALTKNSAQVLCHSVKDLNSTLDICCTKINATKKLIDTSVTTRQ